jgi:hypothetical protein
VVFELARSAWMAQRVPEVELPRRNAQLSAAGSVSETLAFALGGWLYQGLGAAWSLAADAFSYLGSAWCLRGVAEAPPVQVASAGAGTDSAWQRWRRETAAGLQAIAQRPLLRALAGVEALLAFGGALTGTAYMIFVSRDIGLPTGTLGMVFAMGGLGALVGAALAPRLGRSLGAGRTMTLGLAAWTAGALCIPLVTGAGALAIGLLLAQQIVGDAGRTLHDVHDRTLRQTAVPPDLLARADAGIRGAGQLATLAGALAGGVLGSALDARSVLWLAVGCAATATALAAWRLAGVAGPAGPPGSSG